MISGFSSVRGHAEVCSGAREVLPMTSLRLIRGIMLRGASIWELWPAVAALCAFTAVTMTVAIARFRKRLD